MSSFIQASLVYEVVQEACPPGRRHAPLLVGVWNLSGADVWTTKKMGICRDEWEVIMMILVHIEYIQYVSVCNTIVSLSKWASVGESELLAQDPSPQLCVAQIRPRSRPSRSGWNWKDTAAVGFSLEFPELTENFPGRNQALKVGQMWGDLMFLRKPRKLIDGCLRVLKWF